MGLAICGIAFFHVPFVIHNRWLQVFHDSLNCGVDLFLFLSGLGACHSIQRRGAGGYLRQRAHRLLPGLYAFMLPWCAVMAALGAMSGREVLGTVTLLGWWLGQYNQLNWYFSAVWLFFLLAPPIYLLLQKSLHPTAVWGVLTLFSIALGILCPLDRLMTAVTRLPVFLTGMLFGRLEQLGNPHTKLLRALLIPLMLLGLWLILIAYWGYGWVYGYSLGLWWYPYALVIPGAAVLVSDLAALLRKFPALRRIMRPLEWCGESSAEILMIHVGLYKIIFATTRFQNDIWLLILLSCLVLGCLYHYYVVPHLSPHRRSRTT